MPTTPYSVGVYHTSSTAHYPLQCGGVCVDTPLPTTPRSVVVYRRSSSDRYPLLCGNVPWEFRCPMSPTAPCTPAVRIPGSAARYPLLRGSLLQEFHGSLPRLVWRCSGGVPLCTAPCSVAVPSPLPLVVLLCTAGVPLPGTLCSMAVYRNRLTSHCPRQFGSVPQEFHCPVFPGGWR